jgi:hypothetical protein
MLAPNTEACTDGPAPAVFILATLVLDAVLVADADSPALWAAYLALHLLTGWLTGLRLLLIQLCSHIADPGTLAPCTRA